jgi:hypothetical protein
VTPSKWTSSYAAAAYAHVTTQTLASWARRGWISRTRIGTVIYYQLREIEALQDSRADRPARPPIDERALAEADAVLGIRKVAR